LKVISKISWYYNRLSLMSPAEIIHRFNCRLKTQFEKLNYKKALKKSFLFNKLNKFYFDINDLEKIKNYYSSNNSLKQNLFEQANSILEHKFSFFALQNEYFGENINWHKDYLNDKQCNSDFYSDVNYKDFEKNGDIKYIWEINRFQHFYILSQAYLISGEDKYAKEIVNEIDDWIDNNPYLIGVNWTSSLELALRLISWGWALYSLNISGWNINNKLNEKISTGIYQQLDYISNHLSAYSSANNHLIGEAAGLVIAGTLFDFGEKSQKWQEKGFKILQKELNKQIFDDGLNKEQALAYHCFTFDFFLLSFLILEKNGRKIPSEMWQKLEKMSEVLMYLSDDNLNLPNIGDSDDGFVVKFSNDPISLKSIFNIASIIFNRGDFKYLAGNTVDEKTLWILGADSIEKYAKIEQTTPLKKSIYLKNSGYVLLKDENMHSVLDVGNLGYLSIVAHGHSDALSLCLNYKNKEFLIDTGTYAYHTKEKWRNYFKGTSAHNTAMVDNLNQSVIGGNFMWLEKADVEVELVSINDEYDYIRASHDGYIKQKVKVRPQREVLFLKNKFMIIIDRFLNYDNQEYNYSLHWHVNENCRVELEDNNIKIENGSDYINLQTFCDENFKINIIKGSTEPISGWVSKSFDKKMPTNTIQISSFSSKELKFITLLSFNNSVDRTSYMDNMLEISAFEESYSYNLSDYLSR